MRVYYFCNMYLPVIHAGIQASHALHECFNKYVLSSDSCYEPRDAINSLKEWSLNHKVSILLNAGYQSNLEKLVKMLSHKDNDATLAFNFFRESKEALNEALTCVAVVLPEHIYNNASIMGPVVNQFLVVDESGKIVRSKQTSHSIDDNTFIQYDENKNVYILVKSIFENVIRDGEIEKCHKTESIPFTRTDLAVMQYMYRLRLMN